MSDYTVYTIGHSNILFEKFSTLLQTHDITAIADVRSTPYSKFTPQFNREALQKSLRAIPLTVKLSMANYGKQRSFNKV